MNDILLTGEYLKGKCLEIPGRSDEESFFRMQSALEVLGFSADQQHSIFRILASILHLGNIYFNRQPVYTVFTFFMQISPKSHF